VSRCVMHARMCIIRRRVEGLVLTTLYAYAYISACVCGSNVCLTLGVSPTGVAWRRGVVALVGVLIHTPTHMHDMGVSLTEAVLWYLCPSPRLCVCSFGFGSAARRSDPRPPRS
jgi:hypothetical protein